MRLSQLVGTVVAVALIVPAIAAGQSRQSASLEFTTVKPGAPSGLELKIDYVNPVDPAAKPPAVRRVVTELAPGARYDTSVPALCRASDLELTLLGPSACPVGSKVGVGETTIDTGLPPPLRILHVGIDFFNNTNQLVYLNRPGPLEIPRVVVRARVSERQITTDLPFLPGTLPDGAAIDTVEIHDPATTRRVAGELRSYITTPPRCPLAGSWENRVHFTYGDGVTQTVTSRSPCRPLSITNYTSNLRG